MIDIISYLLGLLTGTLIIPGIIYIKYRDWIKLIISGRKFIKGASKFINPLDEHIED